MRQIWITRYGPPEVLAVRQAPDPQPPLGEVRVRVEASGVNFADVLGRLGAYPDLPPAPVVPGYEVSGRVDAVGAEVDSQWIGREVFALTRFGGYADLICVPVKLMDLYEKGVIKPVIARSFRFDDAAAAHHFIQDRQNIGKAAEGGGMG